MYDTQRLIERLEAEYDPDSGFIGQLRIGVFDSAKLERLLGLLEGLDIADQRILDRRLVSLLWMMPTIMGWQTERVIERGGNETQLHEGIDKVQAILNGILGTP